MKTSPSSAGMDGSRIRSLLNSDVAALLETYRQFEKLVPHKTRSGSAHTGEDGRYVEALVRSYLREFLPRNLEALTGFILRPAVKTGVDGRERKGQKDAQSTQLDIIIYDSANYPIYQRLGDDAVVPPEGVVAVCSVKKHLRRGQIAEEADRLKEVGSLCACLTRDEDPRRGPFLSIVTMNIAQDWKPNPTEDIYWEELKDYFTGSGAVSFDELVGYIGILGTGSIFKKRPSPANTPKEATYVWIQHKQNELYFGLQFLLTGVLSVYYDPTRNINRRPGFTGFESGRSHEKTLGDIPVSGLRPTSF